MTTATLREGNVKIVDRRVSLLEGLTSWRNPGNGFLVLDLSFKADPRKRSSEWLTESQSGIPRAEWNREYGDEWIVYDGKPVYQDYDDNGIHLARGSILAGRRSKLISGWDSGPNDVNLAWALGLAQPGERRVLIIDEYAVDDGDAEDFVQVVQSRLRLEWYKLGGFSVHVADQSVFTETNIKTAKFRSFAELMRAHGMSPIPGEIAFSRRRTAVNGLLKHISKTRDSVIIPGLRIHERCELSREAFRGGYAYPKAISGVGGQYKETPAKNKFSHIANAIEYICSRLEHVGLDIPYEGRKLPLVSLV